MPRLRAAQRVRTGARRVGQADAVPREGQVVRVGAPGADVSGEGGRAVVEDGRGAEGAEVGEVGGGGGGDDAVA